jgi:NAD(P)H-dependent FMN reductase
VTQYIFNFLAQQPEYNVVLADLASYQFPIFEERLKFLQNAPQGLIDFSNEVKKADGVIFVSPEYNAGIPAALKNAIDVLTDEWKMKPVGLCGVSGGSFGGAQMLQALQLTLSKVGAWVVPASFQVPLVDKAFDENAVPSDPEGTEKRFKILLQKLEWCITAKSNMDA